MREITPLIQSERLDLLAMTPAFLEASIQGDQTKAQKLLGVTIPSDWWQVRDFMKMRFDQGQKDPAYQPWSPRAISLRQTQTMIGFIGFHTAPAPEYLHELAPGGIEFGYTIFALFRLNGYAKEASQALMLWARKQHQITRFILSINPENQPSLQIAKHFGFIKIGSHIDEEDGLEEIYERRYTE